MVPYEDRAPYIPQDHKQVQQLLQGLEAASGKGNQKGKKGFTGKKTTFRVGGGKDIIVDSWKFNDWDYKRDDLPTYARGLFTYRNLDGNAEIAIRGYDKFFNVDEVNDTQWRNVENFTRGPYELSVKENGCIIFISALDDLTLLVCSKHSTGPRQDADLSHAVAGERWVDKHLASVGKSRAELAIELRRLNVTAVAELCDDSFEEHVLAYDEKSAGLYLHGINVNVPQFATYSGSMVHRFADVWGFKKAQYLVKDDIQSVKSFLDACAETGSYDGRDTEGFVIRCQKKYGNSVDDYEDWFFKYKFEEPYLMYRQWREATKAIIAGRVPKFKKHRKITEEYLIFARRQFARNQGLAKAYNMNHGIIQMRDDFLHERGLKGSEIIRMEEEEEGGNGTKDATSNIVLVPIATIGCGKTTIAVSLAKLFGWGHVQNDNITGKQNRPKQFVMQLSNALLNAPVVIADRNNHQKRERKQLLEDLSAIVPNAKFVALHYVHHPKGEMLPRIREVTQTRVIDRGDNHQTIRAGSKSRGEIVGIMEGFLNRFEPLDPSSEPDNDFDAVIDLDVLEDSRHNLELVVNSLCTTFPKLLPDPPSSLDLDDTLYDALHDYSPDLKHDLNFNSKERRNNADSKRTPDNKNAFDNPKSAVKEAKLEYFCLRLPVSQVTSILEKTFAQADPETARFYRQLQQTRRLQPGFHITLIHRADMNRMPALWNDLESRYQDARVFSSNGGGGSLDPTFGRCKVRLERVIWDERVMTIVARLEDEGWATANQIPHATVGTASTSIKPKESNDLLARWVAGGSGIKDLLLRGEGGEEGAVLMGEARGVTPATR